MHLVIVSGHRNSGKTTLFDVLVDHLRFGREVQGLPSGLLPPPGSPVGGVTTRAVVVEGCKIGYLAKPVDHDETWPLLMEGEPAEGWERGPGRFSHSREGFKLVREYLLARLKMGVLFLDEVGGLELSGGGHCELLDRLYREYGGVVVVAVRSDVDKQVCARWGDGECKVLRVVRNHPGRVEA